MRTDLLASPQFYSVLLKCDEELADATRRRGCPHCGKGALHRSDFERKPRGGPADLDEAYRRRISLCCAKDGCRGRAMPPSVRFLGRKAYLGAPLVLISALRYGPKREQAEELRRMLGVSPRTLERWRGFWLSTFRTSRCWQALRRLLVPPADETRLPLSLLERVCAGDDEERLIRALHLLKPITTGTVEVETVAF